MRAGQPITLHLRRPRAQGEWRSRGGRSEGWQGLTLPLLPRSEVNTEDAGGPHQQGGTGVCQETQGTGKVHGGGPLSTL